MLPYTIDEIRRRVTPIAEKSKLRAVYLFGSYARGEAKEESDIDSLFSTGGTSALMSEISGLDDFELICFLVVK